MSLGNISRTANGIFQSQHYRVEGFLGGPSVGSLLCRETVVSPDSQREIFQAGLMHGFHICYSCTKRQFTRFQRFCVQ